MCQLETFTNPPTVISYEKESRWKWKWEGKVEVGGCIEEREAVNPPYWDFKSEGKEKLNRLTDIKSVRVKKTCALTWESESCKMNLKCEGEENLLTDMRKWKL